MLKRIAILSDIHGNFPALEEVVNDLALRNVNLVVNLGDHLSGPLWPKETIDFLKGQNWFQIMGNHDRQLITQPPHEQGPSDLFASQRLSKDDLDWLRSLSENAEIEGEIFLFHGSPTDDLIYLLETIENGRARLATYAEIKERLAGKEYPIMLCGHTHIPRAVETSDGHLIVNPGSIGLPAYDDTEPEYHIMETGSPHARYAIIEKDVGKWRVELIAIPYDHREAAKQAQRNGRKDWEMGLRTGTMKL